MSGAVRAGALLGAALLAAALLALLPRAARAEYRSYELEVTDVLDCKLNKREKCRSARVLTSMSPDLYTQTNGGEGRIGVQLLATWMCYGDTSGYREVCPRPAPRNAKFNSGDEVRITLKKHITDGWRGKIEVAYYQGDIQANVYGVRFADRQNAYLRYFEKDLERMAAAPPATPSPPAAPQAEPPK